MKTSMEKINRISVLDCTLRDGGYINDWRFGENTIKEIIDALSYSSVEIIECGFLRSDASDKNKSLFSSIESAKKYIIEKKRNTLYAAMIQYGAISASEISEYDGSSIDIIRVTFHEHEIDGALELGKDLIEKGYLVFMQAVGTTTYTDKSLLELIDRINTLRPHGFYMVDTLGTMYRDDLLRMFYLVDNNLDKHIAIGFHCHNNLQMAFSNAQELMSVNSTRNIIIDSSVYGMGRGAGNLCTELLLDYINRKIEVRYDLKYILSIIDKYINAIKHDRSWGGYDIGYFVSAINQCHPNYTSFLQNRQTLLSQDIQAILSTLDESKKGVFDKEYISKEYLDYLDHHIYDKTTREKLKSLIDSRNVFVLAPGKSLELHSDEINEAVIGGAFIISVNFIPDDIPVSCMFISNIKRFDEIRSELNSRYKAIPVFATSNILTEPTENISILDYSTYLNDDTAIADNAGLMCLNLLKIVGVKDITLFGFDGFKEIGSSNYYKKAMILDVDIERRIEMNEAVSRKLKQLGKVIDLKIVGESAYD